MTVQNPTLDLNKKKRKNFIVQSTIVIILIILYSIFALLNDKEKIIIGSKNFTEQIILAELMAQLIEKNTDIKVKRKFNLGGTFICFNALKQGEIDIYPEYTGTGLTAILKSNVISDKTIAYQIVKEQFKKQYNLVWLKPFGINNTYTITMRSEQAENLNITSISDLKNKADNLTAGFTAEFMERPDGLKGLTGKYELDFKIKPKEIDPGLMYQAIREKKVDIICGFATDGRIPAFNLTILDDDKKFFPPYYAAPLIRQKILDKYPAVTDILNKLENSITDKEMSAMNYSVDQNGEKVKTVVKEFLNNNL